MLVELIPCREFPEALSPLACAFADDAAFLAARFPTNVHFRQTGQAPRSSPAPQQTAPLIEALHDSLREESLSEHQRQHLRELASGTALAVVTGQQVGFLGGALYTFLKAVAVISLAHQLRQQLGCPVVPIFWVEDNDSDGREAGSITWWTPDGELHTLQASSNAELLQPLSSAARLLRPGGEWEEALQSVIPHLPQELQQLLQQAYRPQRSWSAAFLSLLQWFLGSRGMLFLQASQARNRRLFVPILERAVEAEAELAAALTTATTWLQERGYPVQITPSFPLLHFHTPEGYRYRVRRLPDGSYAIAQQRYTEAEFRQLFRDHAEAFSPTALLRPLCQDALLPTVAVVLGPAELAYWAQLRELYATLKIGLPIVFLRPSVTLIPPLLQRWLDRSGWQARSFLAPWSQVEARLLSELPSAQQLTRLLEEFRDFLREWHERTLPLTERTDPTLVASLGATRHRIEAALQRWERRFRAAMRRRSTTLLQRARRIWSLLYPAGQPQERVLSWLQLLALCGAEPFQQALDEALDLPPAVHALLSVPEATAAFAVPPGARTPQSPPH